MTQPPAVRPPAGAAPALTRAAAHGTGGMAATAGRALPAAATLSSPPLPAGFGVVMDPGMKQLDEETLFGGAPARVLRLSAAGRAALAELRAGPVHGAAAGRLARKLTDAWPGPSPPAGPGQPSGRDRAHPGPGPGRAAGPLPLRPGARPPGARGG